LGTYFEETLLITLTFVLNACAKGNNAAIPEKKKGVENLKTMGRDQYIPRPESKSGTIDTRMRINKWTVFCHSGQF